MAYIQHTGTKHEHVSESYYFLCPFYALFATKVQRVACFCILYFCALSVSYLPCYICDSVSCVMNWANCCRKLVLTIKPANSLPFLAISCIQFTTSGIIMITKCCSQAPHKSLRQITELTGQITSTQFPSTCYLSSLYWNIMHWQTGTHRWLEHKHCFN